MHLSVGRYDGGRVFGVVTVDLMAYACTASFATTRALISSHYIFTYKSEMKMWCIKNRFFQLFLFHTFLLIFFVCTNSLRHKYFNT